MTNFTQKTKFQKPQILPKFLEGISALPNQQLILKELKKVCQDKNEVLSCLDKIRALQGRTNEPVEFSN